MKLNISSLSYLPILPKPKEMSSLASAREPDSLYHLWKFVNQVVDLDNKQSQQLNQLIRDLKNQKDRKVLDFDLYPFKIYCLPDDMRGPIPNTTTNWRTVRVRGGYVMSAEVSQSSYVHGCDGFQNYAYNNTYAVGATGSYTYGQVVPYAPYDVTIPASASMYWFWIENTTGSYYLRYGADPTATGSLNPNPWTNFPNTDGNHIPIGYCDTATSSSIHQTLVRQLLTTDVLWQSGSGAGVVNGVIYRGLWQPTPPTPYNINNLTVIGTGISAGAYISTINANPNYPSVGPGYTNWCGGFYG